jgi:L-ornithine N5-monooxygenase
MTARHDVHDVHEVHDLVGIGFGPAAIAVAAVFEDQYEFCAPGADRIRTSFLERAGSAAWQPNLLLPGTDIQHHFLRDLATPRNPRSRFTFPNYLKETGRLYPFTLMGNYVTREEWSEYLLWAVRKLEQDVHYDAEVQEIRPVTTSGRGGAADGRITAAAIRYRDTRTGEVAERLARNVLVSIGHQPHVPDVFSQGPADRVFHASQYLQKIAAFDTARPLRVAVIGAGQNAGEIFVHVANTFPHAQVYSLARNSGIRMYELGHFSNEAYFPEETEYFYALDAQRRRRVLAEQHATNYAAVDPDLSTIMYRMVYEDRFFGRGRLHMRKRTEVTAMNVRPQGISLRLREVYIGTPDELDVDLVIVCTGYREPRMPAMLAPFEHLVVLDGNGDPEVTRAHRIVTAPRCDVGIYLNGITEWRHGINSATSFSTLALKAERIAQDITQHRAWSTGPDQPMGDTAELAELTDPYEWLEPASRKVGNL